MKNFIKKSALALAAVSLSASIAFAAMSIDTAKQQGLVGERTDGLLGIVAANPGKDVEALVQDINAKRMTHYQGIADKNGTNVSDVQALAGKRLIEKAVSGEYIQNASGGWQKK